MPLGCTFRLIHAYGKPVGVSNAQRKRRPKSSARLSNWFLYIPRTNLFVESVARICAESSPPRALMLHYIVETEEEKTPLSTRHLTRYEMNIFITATYKLMISDINHFLRMSFKHTTLFSQIPQTNLSEHLHRM